MKLFSQRKGFKRVRTEIQIESMDNALRNGLWNALTSYHFDYDHQVLPSKDRALGMLIWEIWQSYFKLPVDPMRNSWTEAYRFMKHNFMDCEWYEVYDFLEFVVDHYSVEIANPGFNTKFMKYCNSVLERELSAYRFIGGRITEITSREEIAEVEEALEIPLKPVRDHLRTALDLLADRESPDYRNSIKESISAVESLCSLMTNKDKTTLGQALKEVEDGVGLHPALKKAFSNLYGYTSSADGIRHVLLDESNLDFEDAKFMLVSCSAFVNYLVSKAAKTGKEL